MAENETKINDHSLKVYVLHPEANLHRLSRELEACLKKILPHETLDEFIEVDNKEDPTSTVKYSHNKYTDYRSLMNDMLNSRMRAGRYQDKTYVPPGANLAFEAGGLSIKFQLNDSKIKIKGKLSREQKLMLYGTITPYLILKSEVNQLYTIPKGVQNA